MLTFLEFLNDIPVLLARNLPKYLLIDQIKTLIGIPNKHNNF